MRKDSGKTILLEREPLNRNSKKVSNFYLGPYELFGHVLEIAYPKSQVDTSSDSSTLEVFLRNLSMNAGFALSLSLTYEARALSTSLPAFPASSMMERRVLRQSFLFSSRCSNLKKNRKFQFHRLDKLTAQKISKTLLRNIDDEKNLIRKNTK